MKNIVVILLSVFTMTHSIGQTKIEIDSLEFYPLILRDTVKKKNTKKIGLGKDLDIFLLDVSKSPDHYIYENIMMGNFIEAESPEKIQFLKLDESKVVLYKNGDKLDHSSYFRKGEVVSINTEDIHLIERQTGIGKLTKVTGILSIATTLFLAPVISSDFNNQKINEVQYFNIATVGIAGAALSAGLHYCFGKRRFYFFNASGKKRKIWRPITTKKKS